MADDIGQQARGLAAEAVEQGSSMLSRQKDAAAQRMEQAARAVRSGARELQAADADGGRYVEMAAQRLEDFGRQLREKDLNGLISEAQELARRSPAAFFGASLLAGFLLARFMKSSAAASGDGATQMRPGADGADAGPVDWPHPQWSGAPEEVGAPTSLTTSNASRGDHVDG